MAKKEYTAQEYAELLINQMQRYCSIEMREPLCGGVHFAVKGGIWAKPSEPMRLSKGTLSAAVYSDGMVRIMYELNIHDDALKCIELLQMLNRLNAAPGVTFYLLGSEWQGAKLCAREELYIEQFNRTAAKRAADGILMAAMDICFALESLQQSMSEFFGDEELERAAAEANRSPEDLAALPQVFQLPEEESADEVPCFEGVEGGFFDEADREEVGIEWCDAWGDEQMFYERFKNVPVSELSGSELVKMLAVLGRKAGAIRAKLCSAIEQMNNEQRKYRE